MKQIILLKENYLCVLPCVTSLVVSPHLEFEFLLKKFKSYVALGALLYYVGFAHITLSPSGYLK